MVTNEVFPGYEVGKEFKNMTRASTYAFMAYAGAAFPVVFGLLALIVPPDHPRSAAPALAITGVCLILGALLSYAHSISPYRRSTVIRTFRDEYGRACAEFRYLDGTTRIRDDIETENTDGFWKQLGGLTKASITGK